MNVINNSNNNNNNLITLHRQIIVSLATVADNIRDNPQAFEFDPKPILNITSQLSPIIIEKIHKWIQIPTDINEILIHLTSFKEAIHQEIMEIQYHQNMKAEFQEKSTLRM